MKPRSSSAWRLASMALVVVVGAAVAGAEPPAYEKPLAELLGSPDDFLPAPLCGLTRDMTPEQVRRLFPDLPEKSGAGILRLPCPVQDHPLVMRHELKFREGKLYGVETYFKRSLDREAFKRASLHAFEAKWGAVRAAAREKDTITKTNSDGLTVQRAWLVDQWMLEMDLPRKGR